MASERFLKDIGEIHSRLFDHRPVVSGEISYFLKEFEEKRNDRETTRLQNGLDYATELNDILIPASVEMLEKHTPELAAKLATACEMTTIILERESADNSERREVTSQQETQQQRIRLQDWTAFMDTMCEKSASVDAQFEHEMNILNAYYSDLEEKLKLTTGPIT